MLTKKIFLETNLPIFGYILTKEYKKSSILSNKKETEIYAENKNFPLRLKEYSTYLVSDYFDYSNTCKTLEIGFPCFINYKTVKEILESGLEEYCFRECVCLPEDCLLTDLNVIITKRILLPKRNYKVQGFVMSILANSLKDWKDLIFEIKICKKEDGFSIMIIGDGFHIEITEDFIYGYIHPRNDPVLIQEYIPMIEKTETDIVEEIETNEIKKCFTSYPHTMISIDYDEKDTFLCFVIKELLEKQRKIVSNYIQDTYTKLIKRYTDLIHEKHIIEKELKDLEKQLAQFRQKESQNNSFTKKEV